jgi:predicted glycogen debranching enzyme
MTIYCLSAWRFLVIQFDKTVCCDFESASRREWLETNGLGGFASSTIAGSNTRRYHGLLVAATKPPVGRMVLLSKIEETAIVDGRRYEICANRYPGVVHPQGFRYLKAFRLDPYPVFVYDLDGCELVKSVFMVDGENTTAIEYRFASGNAAARAIELRPLIAFRDFHNTAHKNAAINPALEVEDGCVAMTPYQGLPTLYLAHNGASVAKTGEWYCNFEYDIERERGLDYHEDLFQPCVLTFDLPAYGRAVVLASTERHSAADIDDRWAAEIRRRTALASAQNRDEFARTLATAADRFLVRRGRQNTVIAGYHWFSDWGRDTMIALPGLTLSTARPDAARGILLEFAAHVDRGMLPNRFPDAGEAPEYNTVDATLWFFEAVRALAAHTGDYDFVKSNLYSVLWDIVDWHERGTRYGIHADADGLLSAGEPGVQLTWMDAKIGDWVVTPRLGKPVEIQALWYNALRIMENLSGTFGYAAEAGRYGALAGRAQESFSAQFWNEEAGCLFDVIDGENRDASIRPNQIFALSLHHYMLAPERERSVVAVVERDLLTPYGLRTLAPADPHYRGRYEGDPLSRDGSYHQGTVWPWLLGPFLQAYLRVNQHSPAAKEQAREWISTLRRYVENEGVGQIPEVFDGDAPHRAGGCIAQAWSVAELLRVCAEELSPHGGG